MLDETVIDEYLQLVSQKKLDMKQYQIVNLKTNDNVKKRIHESENERLESKFDE